MRLPHFFFFPFIMLGIVSPNLLQSMPKPDEPDQVHVADITYIWTREGWLYLSMILETCAAEKLLHISSLRGLQRILWSRQSNRQLSSGNPKQDLFFILTEVANMPVMKSRPC
ncbi:MAG: hypothetical protein NT007_02870 [Candidatus Kapabacteria bacterium]|nr:hypothetical protein [Candidatus Kapabacteria bacterium]